MNPATDDPRPLPLLTAENRAFWTGGARGELMIQRCAACSTWFHPPAPVCPSCLSRDVAPRPASGGATLLTYSINHQRWLPGQIVPYVIAGVALGDAPDVQLVAELVDCPEKELSIGMSLQVTFKAIDDVWVPQFRPAAAT
jgi:uncharacterized protein